MSDPTPEDEPARVTASDGVLRQFGDPNVGDVEITVEGGVGGVALELRAGETYIGSTLAVDDARELAEIVAAEADVAEALADADAPEREGES